MSSDNNFHVTSINGVITILHHGFTYAFSGPSKENASEAYTTNSNQIYKCIRPECKGSILVQHIPVDKFNSTYKFLKVISRHDNMNLCTKRFTRATDKPNQTLRPNENPKQTKALDLTLDYTVYENCLESNFDSTFDKGASNALANITPSADTQDLFVQLKNEIDIIFQKHYNVIDITKFNRLIGNMFHLLNEKCSQFEEKKLLEETLGERVYSLQNDLKSAKEKIRQCEDTNKLILEDHDEEIKQYIEKQNNQSQVIKNLERTIEKLSKSPVKSPPDNIQSTQDKKNATTQYSPVKITPEPESNQHDVTPINLTQETGDSQDNVTITSAVINVNNSVQSTECYVSISKFLDLESKMKILEQDIQGLKNGLELRQNKVENSLPLSQERLSISKPDIKKNDKQPSVFIVGDGHARNLKETLSKKIPSNWTIKSSYDERANFKAVSEHLIQSVDKCDHLILFAGSNDMFTSSKRVMLASLKTILEKFKGSKQIHLLLIPERYDDINYNFHIKNVNEQIQEFVTPYQNVTTYNPKHIVDSWDYYDNFFIGRNGKIKICAEIAKIIRGKEKNTTDKAKVNFPKLPGTENRDTKIKSIKQAVKFKDTEEPKFKHSAPKSSTNNPEDRNKTRRSDYFKRNETNKRNTYVYHTYQNTSRARSYDNNDDMTFTIPNDLHTINNNKSYYSPRSYTSRRWSNTSHHRGRNFP
uniref:Uncharacterized protein n=2 Tax=Cacopsylla melanoneura TaxID=428564 RepID=A0A8D8XL33_9HEMI